MNTTIIIEKENATFFAEMKELATEKQGTISDSEVFAEIVENFAHKLDSLFLKRFSTASVFYDNATAQSESLKNECDNLRNEIAPFFESERTLDNEIFAVHKAMKNKLPHAKSYSLPRELR